VEVDAEPETVEMAVELELDWIFFIDVSIVSPQNKS
jgi:hypothetical protein